MAKRRNYHTNVFFQERPDAEYFAELQRVSKNQIVWGGNYFADLLPTSQCWVVWDKKHPETINYADCELAWTSFDRASRIFRFMWNGMLQEDMKHKEKKIHPTQKPVALYEWLLDRFSNSGEKILDTHVGSASSLIACEKHDMQYVGFEIDKTYYEAAKERMRKETEQITLWKIGYNPYQE